MQTRPTIVPLSPTVRWPLFTVTSVIIDPRSMHSKAREKRIPLPRLPTSTPKFEASNNILQPKKAETLSLLARDDNKRNAGRLTFHLHHKRPRSRTCGNGNVDVGSAPSCRSCGHAVECHCAGALSWPKPRS